MMERLSLRFRVYAGKFISMDDSLAIDVKEVDTKMVYHHSHSGKSRGGEEGILYCMEVVEPMQEFTGRIYTKEKYVKRCLSSSYSLNENDKNYSSYVKEIEKIFDEFSENGIYKMPNMSVLYIGKI